MTSCATREVRFWASSRTFAACVDYDDFARRVPLGDYDSFSSLPRSNAVGEAKPPGPGISFVTFRQFVRQFDPRQIEILPISARQIAQQRRAGADAS